MEKAMTYGELKAVLNELSEEQLEEDVHLWGDEYGAWLASADTLEEEYILTDDGYCPASCLSEEEKKETESGREAGGKYGLPKGTLILMIDGRMKQVS